MIFEQIDLLKQQYTDKYVVVDAGRPELARFRDVVGQVKTVNMSGRALVEFDDYHINVGWYDIDLEFLKVVDKPAPKPKEAPAKKPAAKAAPEAKAAAPKTPVAKAAAAPGKPSTADILAKLRGGGAAAPSTGAAAPASEQAAPTKAAAPKSASPAGRATPKVDRAKMSVADMLAAARAGGAPKSGEPASAGGTSAPAEPIKTIPARDVEEMVEADDTPPTAKVLSDKAPSAKVDKKSMSVDQMIAWCREHDTH